MFQLPIFGELGLNKQGSKTREKDERTKEQNERYPPSPSFSHIYYDFYSHSHEGMLVRREWPKQKKLRKGHGERQFAL